jgi:hypothetical protein
LIVGSTLWTDAGLTNSFDGAAQLYTIDTVNGATPGVQYSVRQGAIVNIFDCAPQVTPTPTLPIENTPTPTPVMTLSGYSFHGGNADYPFVQASDGLTASDPGDLYYNGPDGPYTVGTLSQALGAILDQGGAPTYSVNTISLPEGGAQALGTEDVVTFASTNSEEYYYIILPNGDIDLTELNPMHLVDGGIETRAVQKVSFTWNGNLYWLYRLGGGSQKEARQVSFSDND